MVRERLSVNDSVRGVLKIVGHQLSLAGIETEIDLNENLPPIVITSYSIHYTKLYDADSLGHGTNQFVGRRLVQGLVRFGRDDHVDPADLLA